MIPLSTNCGVPRSLLDTDMYKFTMQQAVLFHFPTVEATYRFTNRDLEKGVYFTRDCVEQFRSAVSRSYHIPTSPKNMDVQTYHEGFSELTATETEMKWLKETCPYLKPVYLNYLSAYRFDPDQISIKFVPIVGERGNIEIECTGPWVQAILWEVPLMACLSEIYFQSVVLDWDYKGQADAAYKKCQVLVAAGCIFSEFGTRRRRSFHTQDLVLGAIVEASHDCPGEGLFSGTSNVYLAYKHGINPIGTTAHEWFMGVGLDLNVILYNNGFYFTKIAALRGYHNANMIALDLWENVYLDSLHIALTDTFSSEAFFKSFTLDRDRANRWKGLRQDSGDPLAFAPRAKEMYSLMGIDHRDKMIIFSDSLNLESALNLKTQCDIIGFKASFGIGTFFTNDFSVASSDGSEKSKALNMVIKLSSVDGLPCVKISDDLNKNTGDCETVQKVKYIFGLTK